MRQRLDAVFEDAAFFGRCASNPAAAIKRKLHENRPQAKKGSFRALPYPCIGNRAKPARGPTFSGISLGAAERHAGVTCSFDPKAPSTLSTVAKLGLPCADSAL